MENGVVQTNGSPMFERKVEFHSATKPTFSGHCNGEFRIQTLNDKPEFGKTGSGSVGKKLDGAEFGFDPELNFEFTLRTIGAGLENLGNTCYLNSVLQCLTHTEPLAAYLQSGRHQSSCRIAGFCALCAIQKHVSRALKSTGSIVAPKDMVSNLRRISRTFRNSRQEDAHEYMVNLLESMHKCCLPSGIAIESPNAYEKSLVHKIFGGRLRSQVKCLECFHSSNKFDPFLDLSLEIANADSLHKALKKFTAAELLDGGERQYNCQQCKQKVKASKQLTVDKAPNVLTIHLKRFRPYDPGHKIDKKVQFDPTMDLKPFVSGSYEGDLKYTLYGVLVHYGWSTDSGHYYCFVRTSSGIWYSLDDMQVVQVSEMAVLKQKAYMLFYVRDRKSFAVKKPINISKKENLNKDVWGNIPCLNMKTALKESIKNGTNQRLTNSADSTPSVKKDVLGLRLAKNDSQQEASTLRSSNSVLSASSLPLKDPVQQFSSEDPVQQISARHTVQHSKDPVQQFSSVDPVLQSSSMEVNQLKSLSEEKSLASSGISVAGDGCVEQNSETVSKGSGANSQYCCGDLSFQHFASKDPVLQSPSNEHVLKSSSMEVNQLKCLSEEKPLAFTDLSITGDGCVEQNAETVIKGSEANSQKNSDVSLTNAFDCCVPQESATCKVLTDGTVQKNLHLEFVSNEEGLHKDSSQYREPSKLETVDLVRPPSKSSPESIQDNSIFSNRNNPAACGKAGNDDQKSAPESLELPSSSNVSSESIIVKASHHPQYRISRRKYMNGWTAGMRMGSRLFLMTNLGIWEKKKHKRSRSRASSSRKLIQESLQGSEAISSDLGPSTSVKASKISLNTTHRGRKIMKSQSKKKIDKSAKKEARNPKESLVIKIDRELNRRVDHIGAVLATDMKFQQPLFSDYGAGQCDTNGPTIAVDYRRDTIQNTFLNMLTRGLEETVVARWDGIDITTARVVESTKMKDVGVGYMPDKWDKEYDRGKRKKLRHVKHEFTCDGPNPFKQIANEKSKLKRSRMNHSNSGNEPFRIQ